MSKKYIPLYTKYRPMVFADITGQESTVKALSNAVQSGRIMHAYLFCGPRGTGKTSSARIFAKSLNCVNGPTVTPCGKCAGCLDVINSTPVDVIEIDAASNRSVDDARNILEKVQYAPLHGKYKIYIIDEVHMLTNEASNALLKTLEEPPENVIFILATTESHKVLETIVSRCQRYDFRRITTADIVKRLDFIAKSENIQITDEALLAIAKNAAGGMRDAVALLDQLSVLGQNGTITVDDVNEILGQISYDKVYEIAECIYNSDTENALKILSEINDRGNEPSRVLTALIQYFRDMLILKSCTDKSLVFSMTKINEAIYDKIKEQSEKFDKQTLIFLAERLSYHFAKLKENTNKYMWAELCIIDITSLEKVPTIAELTEKVARLEAMLSTGQIPVQKATSQIQQRKEFSPQATPVTKPVVPAQPTKPSQFEEAKVQEHAKPSFAKPVEQVQKPEPIEQKPIEVQKEVSKEEQKNLTQKEQPMSKETGDMLADWQQICAEIKPPASFFYQTFAKPIEVTRYKIVLGFAQEGGVKTANEPMKKGKLQEAACKYFDVSSIKIECKVGTASALSTHSAEKKTESFAESVEKHTEAKNASTPTLTPHSSTTTPSVPHAKPKFAIPKAVKEEPIDMSPVNYDDCPKNEDFYGDEKVIDKPAPQPPKAVANTDIDANEPEEIVETELNAEPQTNYVEEDEDCSQMSQMPTDVSDLTPSVNLEEASDTARTIAELFSGKVVN